MIEIKPIFESTSVSESAWEHYQNKLARPAYAAYRDNESLRTMLYSDCLQEAAARQEFGVKL